jgi:Ca2+/Na+ antiporter
MSPVNVDSVDIFLILVFPPIAALVAYGAGHAAGRVVNGGRPLSNQTKVVLRYGAVLTLGVCYIVMILATFKLPNWSIWGSLVVWTILVFCLAKWRKHTKRDGEDASTSQPT